jgi:enamine deaminase RidA (YjgF/YER057c/UK114 family)
VLGVFTYGADEPKGKSDEVLRVWVPTPVVGAESWHEVWVSERPVKVSRKPELTFSSDGDLLFGYLVLDDPADASLESAVYSAYSTLFDTLDREGYPALLRVWNYFPRINDDACGIERYRAFNVGRHEAFCSKGRAIGEGHVPAACALGTRQGGLVLGFLAGKRPATVIENPRQTNAYRYPPEFGPKSPTFSRGVLIGDALLISGTASIVGSESKHPDDVALQVDETIRNLERVVEEARKLGFDAGDSAGLCLNVYLRHATDYPVVRRKLEAVFGNAKHVAYIMADVCRADLLVEIEAFWMPDRK